ncbi:beta-N-acetylhexosaminidase [Neomegalonema perideroedes]|uniref:beta-N-acetylhexosaminidase n=1 Tax=Neomegalonema perideroedes TaxID=217219 RepID=UPI000365BC22|nr:beta-N-acetylhexosaminidase [Neomegalonema perideroedes]
MAASPVIFGCLGPALSDEERGFFREVSPWGFILFRRNVESPEQLRRLTADLRESVGREAPILIDQEGGRVARLRAPHWRTWPAPLLGMEARLEEAEKLAALTARFRLIAAELRGVGVDVCCAPLLDVPVPGGHDIIGDRAIGLDAETVARRGFALREGLTSGGALPVIKHIPGHGRAMVDSHLHLPCVTASREELERVDFAPFRQHADAPLGMTGHIVFEAIDPEAPATLSRKVVQEAIRGAIGFDGLLMTDDLSMKALSGDFESRARQALAAGCDMILHCNGEMEEMAPVARALSPLTGEALRRAEAADAARLAIREAACDEEADLALWRAFEARAKLHSA